MKIDYPIAGPFSTITCDSAQESATIRIALDRLASGATHESAANNRRAARAAYEALVGIDPPDDDFYRSTQCTGGTWCRCPVTSPCPQRGTSHVTGMAKGD